MRFRNRVLDLLAIVCLACVVIYAVRTGIYVFRHPEKTQTEVFLESFRGIPICM